MDHVGDGDGGGGNDRRGAGRGRGRNPWSTSSEQPPPLRRPHSAVTQQTTSVNEVNEMLKNTTINEVVKNSELSAEAAEFVPRSLMQGNSQGLQRTSVQDRLSAARNQQSLHHAPQNHHYGNQQQQFSYQMQQMQYQQYVDAEQTSQAYQRYDGYNSYDRNHENRNIENNRGDSSLTNVLSHLNTAMQTLTRNPDQFDNLVVPLVCNITPHLKNSVNTQAIVSAIILKSISDSNFRYSGARLCSHLDAVDTPLDDTPSIFRKALYERCREETEAQSVAWPKIEKHSPEDEKKCHGLMLCLAELVAQMDSRPASILGKLLVELISIGLKNPGPNSAKFICQSLKLAGQYLERDSSTNREEIERIMRELSELVIEGRVDAHVGRMVTSVRELRSGNWGRVVTTHGPLPVEVNQIQVQQQIHQQQFDEPVLYGPDGQVLSPEERRFCQDLANMDDGLEDWHPGSGSLDEDEDDIIAAAYEEFLKMPPNKPTTGVNRG